MMLKPVQKPHAPIWFGGGHPDAIRRTPRSPTGGSARAARASPGSGSVSSASGRAGKLGRDPAGFPSPSGSSCRGRAAGSGPCQLGPVVLDDLPQSPGGRHLGRLRTPEQVREKLEALVAAARITFWSIRSRTMPNRWKRSRRWSAWPRRAPGRQTGGCGSLLDADTCCSDDL